MTLDAKDKTGKPNRTYGTYTTYVTYGTYKPLILYCNASPIEPTIKLFQRLSLVPLRRRFRVQSRAVVAEAAMDYQRP